MFNLNYVSRHNTVIVTLLLDLTHIQDILEQNNYMPADYYFGTHEWVFENNSTGVLLCLIQHLDSEGEEAQAKSHAGASGR